LRQFFQKDVAGRGVGGGTPKQFFEALRARGGTRGYWGGESKGEE